MKKSKNSQQHNDDPQQARTAVQPWQQHCPNVQQ